MKKNEIVKNDSKYCHYKKRSTYKSSWERNYEEEILALRQKNRFSNLVLMI